MRFRQGVTLGVLWLSYAAIYLLRKPLGVGKSAMAADLDLQPYHLGLLDTAFLLPYALVQLFLGFVGDVLGPRRALAVCLVGAAASMITFGAWSSLAPLLAMLAINGAFQSLCWSNSIKAISTNVDKEDQSFAVGIFSTSAFAGGIVATALASMLLEGGWRAMWVLPSTVVAAHGVLNYFILHDATAPPAIPTDAEDEGAKQGAGGTLTTRQLFSMPLVAEVSLAYFLVKFVRYSFYMWLPTYLEGSLQYDAVTAGYLSISFEVGGVAASAGMAWVTKKFFNGNDLNSCRTSLGLASVGLLLFLATSNWGVAFNCVFLAMVGAGNCGVDPTLSGTLPMKIAAQYLERGGAHDPTSQLAGAVNGAGSVGAVLEGLLIGAITAMLGWDGFMMFIVAMSLLSFGVMFRASRAFASK